MLNPQSLRQTEIQRQPGGPCSGRRMYSDYTLPEVEPIELLRASQRCCSPRGLLKLLDGKLACQHILFCFFASFGSDIVGRLEILA
jgi:hypothetical protein